MDEIRVGVIGHFGNGKNLLNGQTIKTKIITEGLKEKLGEKEVICVDTHGGLKKLPKIFFEIYGITKKCKNIIMFPAHNGILFIAPTMLIWGRIFDRKLHYVVIGGWLAQFLQKHRMLKRILLKFDGIYVETTTMKKNMEELGFSNVIVIPNCKKLDILNEKELSCSVSKPYKLCTFSRVIKEKGIEDAIKCIYEINTKNEKIIYELDIFGQIGVEYKKRFLELQSKFPQYIKYCGEIPFSESVKIIKEYDLLLFPTRFYTEGIPGTIIDAYASGVPVLASKWENYSDIIDDEMTGIGYEFENVLDFKEKLYYLMTHSEKIVNMKKNCLKKAELFTVDFNMKKFIEFLE